MYQALYRSYRPETFDELLGQDHIVRVLKNQIDTNTTGHAYLFAGTRGTGKTTTARLLAKGLNCLAPEGSRPCGVCSACMDIAGGVFVDVLEIDAASNNGVEHIRELRESVHYPPAAGRNKVYVVDEAHMLSQAAANALLKTLEEPPKRIVFILATTEPQRLPATILSRCLRLDFHRVSERAMIERFAEICRERGIEADEEALALIAMNADGSVRDGLSLLDRCIAGTEYLSEEHVLSLLGLAGHDVFVCLTDHVQRGQVGDALLLLNDIIEQGKDAVQFMRDWLEHFRTLLIIKYVRQPQHVLSLSKESVDRLTAQAESLSMEEIKGGIVELSEALAEARWSTRPRMMLELAAVRLATANAADVPVPPSDGASKEPVAERRPAAEPVAERRPAAEPVAEQRPVAEKREAAHPAPQTDQERRPEPPPAEADDAPDQGLWQRILADRRISGMARTCGSVLKEVTEHQFVVQVTNSIQENQFHKEKQILEDVFEELTGKTRRLSVALDTSDGQQSFL